MIRNITENDYKDVLNIARNAFWNLYTPGCNEHLIIHKLKNHIDFLQNISFVIIEDGKIIGAIFYTKAQIIRENGEIIPSICLAPVCIDPAYQRQGYGRKLIKHSLETARKHGHTSVILLGYPHHYAPYGFICCKKFGICMGDGNFYIGLQALELTQDALKNAQGFAKFSEVFEVSDKELLEFDKAFEPKEKFETESQKTFRKTAGMLDKNEY